MELQQEDNKELKSRQLWSHPWKYKESFIVTFNLLVFGFAIEALTGGDGIKMPAFPVNLFFILGLGVIQTIIYLRFKDNLIIKWLSGVPAAISVIVIYAILVLLLGFVPQDMAQPPIFLKILGLSHVKTSWPFLIIQFYFLVILGFVTLRRTIPFKIKNIGFLLNHFGLWLTILAAGLSSSDLQRYKIDTYEKEKETNIGLDENNDKFELPFSVKLIDFNIIEYNPKLAIFDVAHGTLVMGKAQTLPMVEPDLVTTLGDWQLKVLTYLPQAIYKGGHLVPTDSAMGYPAAFIFAKNLVTQDTVRGWVSTGGIIMHPDYFHLIGKQYLTLNSPEPKKFYSKLVFFGGKDKPDTVQISVNKPFSIDGWTVYQSGYNDKMGKYSNLSVLEAVRDPWLPVVYVGIFMLLAGAIYMFWIGKDIKE